MIKGELVLHQKEDGSVQYRDDLSFMWCACGKPANNHFPEEEGHWKFQCEIHAHEEKFDMKYFEFCRHEYYALVAAESIEKAVDIYLEIVGHDEEKEVRAIKPTEISFYTAFKCYRSVRAKEDGLKHFFPKEYMETFEVMKNTAIVLDGAIS